MQLVWPSTDTLPSYVQALSVYESQQATDLSREIRFTSPVPANPPLNAPSSTVAFTS